MDMINSFFRFILLAAVLFSAAVLSVGAQDNSGSRNNSEPEDLPKGIKETLVKNRIDREKKDFQELLERGAEAAKLSEEVDKSFVLNKTLTLEDKRKLERLEKISKKIREELGASGDEADYYSDEKVTDFNSVKLSDTSDAIGKLKSVSSKLAEELKKTSRYTISTVAIQSSNAVLRIVRFIRTGKN